VGGQQFVGIFLLNPSEIGILLNWLYSLVNKLGK